MKRGISNRSAIVKTSAKGQVVIPADFRKKIGLKPGGEAHLYLRDSQVIVEAVGDEDPIDAMCGMFADPKYSYTNWLLEERKIRT